MQAQVSRTKEYNADRLKGLREFWLRYKRSKTGVAGLIIITAFLFIALSAPYLAPYGPFNTEAGPVLSPPSWHNPLGTDDLGRDVLSMIMWGARVSLFIGFSAVALAVSIGVTVGCTAGFLGGKVDTILMRVCEFFLIIPSLMLIIVLVALYGTSLYTVIIVIGATGWPGAARLVRGEILSLKEREFVESAKAIGERKITIAVRELLPNAISPVIVSSTLQIGGAILIESSLAFLGLSDPSIPDWGGILSAAQTYLATAWWLSIFAGLALSSVVISMSLIGDALNSALNPRLKEV